MSSEESKRPANGTKEVSPIHKLKFNSEEPKPSREQSKLVYDYKDKLQKELTKEWLWPLLEPNDQHVPWGESKILDLLADAMAFGSPFPFSDCKDGQLAFWVLEGIADMEI